MKPQKCKKYIYKINTTYERINTSYVCHGCQKTFLSETGARLHNKAVHGKNKKIEPTFVVKM